MLTVPDDVTFAEVTRADLNVLTSLMAAYYRERKMAAVIFSVDAEYATGHRRISNEEVAAVAGEYADTLIPFASVDPWKGRAGAREVRRLVEEHGVRGFKFHPSIQGIAPNDPVGYPVLEAIEEMGEVVHAAASASTAGSASPSSP